MYTVGAEVLNPRPKILYIRYVFLHSEIRHKEVGMAFKEVYIASYSHNREIGSAC